MTRIVAIAVLAGALTLLSGLAFAQEPKVDLNDPSTQGKIVALCRAQPNNDACATVEQTCMAGGSYAGTGLGKICSDLGWTRAAAAKRKVKALREKCSDNDFDDGCVKLRTACREKQLSCELVTELACDGTTGSYCDTQYVCTERHLGEICSGSSAPGSKHFFMQVSYIKPDEALGNDMIYASAQGYEQQGTGSTGMCTAVDMGAGWQRGDDFDGFAYELEAMVGAGMRHGAKYFLGLVGGGGFSGILGTGPDIGFGWTLSAQAHAGFEVVPNIDLVAFVRPSWVYREDARQDGSDTFGFADEMTAGLNVAWIKKHQEGSFSAGRGWGLQLFYKEQVGISMFGIGLGIGTADASSN